MQNYFYFKSSLCECNSMSLKTNKKIKLILTERTSIEQLKIHYNFLIILKKL